MKDLVTQEDLVLGWAVVVRESTSTKHGNLQSKAKVKLEDKNLLMLIKKL